MRKLLTKLVSNETILHTYIHTYIHTYGAYAQNNTSKRGGTTYYLSVSPIYLIISKVRRLQVRGGLIV